MRVRTHNSMMAGRRAIKRSLSGPHTKRNTTDVVVVVPPVLLSDNCKRFSRTMHRSGPLGFELENVEWEKKVMNSWPKKCTFVVREILQTERAYIASLEEIILGYMMPLHGYLLSQGEGPNFIHTVFGNVNKLRQLHEQLLDDLHAACGDPHGFAEVFMNASFGLYREYCTHYTDANLFLQKTMSENEKLRLFIKQCQHDLEHPLPLHSQLIKPVQRILKYQLMLHEMLKYIDEEDIVYPDVKEALDKMKTVAEEINTSFNKEKADEVEDPANIARRRCKELNSLQRSRAEQHRQVMADMSPELQRSLEFEDSLTILRANKYPMKHQRKSFETRRWSMLQERTALTDLIGFFENSKPAQGFYSPPPNTNPPPPPPKITSPTPLLSPDGSIQTGFSSPPPNTIPPPPPPKITSPTPLLSPDGSIQTGFSSPPPNTIPPPPPPKITSPTPLLSPDGSIQTGFSSPPPNTNPPPPPPKITSPTPLLSPDGSIQTGFSSPPTNTIPPPPPPKITSPTLLLSPNGRTPDNIHQHQVTRSPSPDLEEFVRVELPERKHTSRSEPAASESSSTLVSPELLSKKEPTVVIRARKSPLDLRKSAPIVKRSSVEARGEKGECKFFNRDSMHSLWLASGEKNRTEKEATNSSPDVAKLEVSPTIPSPLHSPLYSPTALSRKHSPTGRPKKPIIPLKQVILPDRPMLGTTAHKRPQPRHRTSPQHRPLAPPPLHPIKQPTTNEEVKFVIDISNGEEPVVSLPPALQQQQQPPSPPPTTFFPSMLKPLKHSGMGVRSSVLARQEVMIEEMIKNRERFRHAPDYHNSTPTITHTELASKNEEGHGGGGGRKVPLLPPPPKTLPNPRRLRNSGGDVRQARSLENLA